MMLLFGFWCLLAIAMQNVAALKCRAENQQMDMQFEKLLQICRRRNSGSSSSDSNTRSTEDSSSESDSNSDEDIFSKKFFSKNQDRNRGRDQRDRNGENRMSNSYNNNNRTDGNRWNQRRIRRRDNHQSTYTRNSNNRNNDFAKSDNTQNYFNQDQACVIQCLFNEFNVVDRKGFPMRNSVVRLMNQNVQDPELRDFIEESVVDCFRYLQPVSKDDNCEFSQSLVSCLADKGKEKCEDWEE